MGTRRIAAGWAATWGEEEEETRGEVEKEGMRGQPESRYEQGKEKKGGEDGGWLEEGAGRKER